MPQLQRWLLGPTIEFGLRAVLKRGKTSPMDSRTVRKTYQAEATTLTAIERNDVSI